MYRVEELVSLVRSLCGKGRNIPSSTKKDTYTLYIDRSNIYNISRVVERLDKEFGQNVFDRHGQHCWTSINGYMITMWQHNNGLSNGYYALDIEPK